RWEPRIGLRTSVRESLAVGWGYAGGTDIGLGAAQGGLYGRDEGGMRVGFRQDAGNPAKAEAPQDFGFAETAGEDHGKIRPQRLDQGERLFAAHPRHDQVQDHRRNGGFGLQNLQGLPP